MRALSECSAKCRSVVNSPVQWIAVENVLLEKMTFLLQDAPEKCRCVSDLHFDILIKNTGYSQHQFQFFSAVFAG